MKLETFLLPTRGSVMTRGKVGFSSPAVFSL